MAKKLANRPSAVIALLVAGVALVIGVTQGVRAFVRASNSAPASHAPPSPTWLSAALRQLSGSPPPLAALHRESSQLLDSGSSLSGEVQGLRGYPIVVNAWASWCTPCQHEFGLFAAAAARFGRRVAFLGADTDDSAGVAQAFLRKHPVTYPSYRTSASALGSIASVAGLPTTIFISPAGKVLYVHNGQYVREGTLAQDIQTYASSE